MNTSFISNRLKDSYIPALTNAMFNETQHEVNLCKKKKKKIGTWTFTDDQLTTSFLHRFNISGSEQTKEKSSQQLLCLLTFNKYL
jgi:hypothetical protein